VTKNCYKKHAREARGQALRTSRMTEPGGNPTFASGAMPGELPFVHPNFGGPSSIQHLALVVGHAASGPAL